MKKCHIWSQHKRVLRLSGANLGKRKSVQPSNATRPLLLVPHQTPLLQIENVKNKTKTHLK
jgi:hypothetical protein